MIVLEEEREKARNKFTIHQNIIKKWFDKHKAGNQDFQVGDLVLKWDKTSEPKGKHSKFRHLWLGPLQVIEKLGKGTYKLQNVEGKIEPLPLNSHLLKMFIS